MIHIDLLKNLKRFTTKANPIEAFRYIHLQGNEYMATNGFHFLSIKNEDEVSDESKIIDVHKIQGKESFETKTEIGIFRERNGISEINLSTLREQEFQPLAVHPNIQLLLTQATNDINHNVNDGEVWYLDMAEYYGILKGFNAIKIPQWICEVSYLKKSIKLTAIKDNLSFEYYLILRTDERQPTE